jgi:hypothetical protein
MSMVTYAVYDVETGEVVHVHVEPAGLDSSPEEIVHLADIHQSRRLHAIRLSRRDLPPGPARVVDGELRAVEGENWAAARSGGEDIEPAVERQYVAWPPPGVPGPDD